MALARSYAFQPGDHKDPPKPQGLRVFGLKEKPLGCPAESGAGEAGLPPAADAAARTADGLSGRAPGPGRCCPLEANVGTAAPVPALGLPAVRGRL